MTEETSPIHEDNNCAPAPHRAAECPARPPDPTRLRIGLISNPLSAGNRNRLGPVERMLAGPRRPLHRQAVDPQEVKAAIRDFAAGGVNLVAVNGGDGTIHAVLTALFTVEWPDGRPFLALLRAGGTSMIARDVGLPGSRLQGLSRLLGWAYAGRGAASLVKRPVLRLEWEKGGEPMYGMFFGAGAIYEGIKFCHDPGLHQGGGRGTCRWFDPAAIFAGRGKGRQAKRPSGLPFAWAWRGRRCRRWISWSSLSPLSRVCFLECVLTGELKKAPCTLRQSAPMQPMSCGRPPP